MKTNSTAHLEGRLAYATLEDFFGDIVGKAMRGLGKGSDEIRTVTGLSDSDLGRIASYDLIPDDDTIRKLAVALSLDGEKLIRVAHGWVPEGGNDPLMTERIRVDRVILSAGMEVNAYVLGCLETGEGALIDAGGQPDRISLLIDASSVRITHILVTHGHGDHVGAVGEMKSRTGGRVYCSAADAGMLSSGVVDEHVADGWSGEVGAVKVTAHELPGHTTGGIGFYTGGAFFSGDALFAASLGGARGVDVYTGQIDSVREKVLSLPVDTRIFPGHGPVTTVGQEIANNPCFV
jgi:hydroxyacylglutathione hydrolase